MTPTSGRWPEPTGSKFDISTGGDLTFKVKPDYENPTDTNMDNVYEVTVRAADADGYIGTLDEKVTVINEDEPGTVTLSKTRPRVGIAVTASVTDPDGSISGLTWQWRIGAITGTQVEGVTATPRRPHRRCANVRHLHAEGGGRWRHPDGNGELLRRAERP